MLIAAVYYKIFNPF